MKLRFILIFILGIFASCDNENIEPDEQPVEQPVELRTDDTITVTNINPDSSTSSSARGPYNLLGYGYDVTGQFADSSAAGSQIIDVVKLKEDRPGRVEIGRFNTSSSRASASENCETYSQIISSRTKATEGSRSFKGAITSYFPDQDALSDKYIYAGYILYSIRKNVRMMSDPDLFQKYVTDAFRADVQSKSPQNIVEKYGTHILTDILLGSKLVILYQAETVNKDREKAARLGLTVAMNNVFGLGSGYGGFTDATSATGNFSQKLSYKTSGGDMYKLFQTTSPGSKHPTVDISSWLQSLPTADEEFIDFTDIVLPLYEVIEDPVKKEEVKKYIQAYLAENQVRL